MAKDKKKKNRNKSDYGDDFIPPDGGYAWIICITSGLANFSVLPVFQQFGLLYRDKLLGIGLSHSEITGIINMNSAIASLNGFLNGPIFRRFSYRQVGIFGSLLTTLAIFLSSISNSFWSFFFSFGILLAFGFGLSMSANSLVFNVYFKEKRSKASSWTWTITGIGPVIFPYIVNYLVKEFGIQGAILIVAGISAHALAFSLTYQPVLWHAKNCKNKIEEFKLLNHNEAYPTIEADKNICKKCNCVVDEKAMPDDNSSSSDDDDDEEDQDDVNSSIDLQIIAQDPETPMMHTKENFYKSNDNLAMRYTRQLSRYSFSKNLERKLSLIPNDHFNEKIYAFQRETCKCKSETIKSSQNLNQLSSTIVPKEHSKPSLFRRFILYFELDLLNDYSFLNVIIGLTLSFFSEINFSILTPFFLADFELEKYQIAFLMSMPAIPDLACRFLIQFIVKKLKWDNRIFYLFGIGTMTIFRTIIALRPSYTIICISFFCIGIGKAFRTIFYGIIIPDYVPLKKLPAALGINRLFGGIFPIICGPFVGIIRDRSDYQVTLHFLNLLSAITIVSWTLELLFVHRKRKNKSTFSQPV